MQIPEKLKSRKLWVTLIMAVLEVAKKELGLSIPVEAVYLILVWLAGQSAVDVVRAKSS